MNFSYTSHLSVILCVPLHFDFSGFDVQGDTYSRKDEVCDVPFNCKSKTFTHPNTRVYTLDT